VIKCNFRKENIKIGRLPVLISKGRGKKTKLKSTSNEHPV
jgi:hypothetical protein